MARKIMIFTVISLIFCGLARAQGGPSFLSEIKLPPGFKISVYAAGVKGARSMALGDMGTLFVGTREAGKVYAVRDTDKDNEADDIIVIAKGLNMPNGVAFFDGALFVSEINRVLKYDKIEGRLNDPPKPEVINNSFPADRHHGWKFIRFGPDGLLYIPVGAPCNICEKGDPRYASIMRMRPDGAGLEIFSGGVRNTVGFDWDPRTNTLWFTDNGADWMGDDYPPDELNHAPVMGMHFGFPYCHGAGIKDARYGGERRCSEFAPPVKELSPHAAALGMRFYTGAMFPEEFKNQIFIAEHGSWNRTAPVGYRIMLVKMDEGANVVSYEVFAGGWLKEKRVFGRPVDLQVMPDGALLVSDDYAGAIYRISYEDKE